MTQRIQVPNLRQSLSLALIVYEDAGSDDQSRENQRGFIRIVQTSTFQINNGFRCDGHQFVVLVTREGRLLALVATGVGMGNATGWVGLA